ncbi:MAG: hypothetical protein Hyperionvirus2_207 [Hyperionvirus sp.]|uniref:Uncharacterized protein n=1 Tax=Hyperionvirus sp. TaxID=2487770 RepID=A0A3G5AC24_9VIRU|nr:MAG: hypothetical protein Hyperionvirus2_207 [Hyperionvirus sp.]
MNNSKLNNVKRYLIREESNIQLMLDDVEEAIDMLTAVANDFEVKPLHDMNNMGWTATEHKEYIIKQMRWVIDLLNTNERKSCKKLLDPDYSDMEELWKHITFYLKGKPTYNDHIRNVTREYGDLDFKKVYKLNIRATASVIDTNGTESKVSSAYIIAFGKGEWHIMFDESAETPKLIWKVNTPDGKYYEIDSENRKEITKEQFV